MHIHLKHLNKIDVILKVTKSLKFAFIKLLFTKINIFYLSTVYFPNHLNIIIPLVITHQLVSSGGKFPK